MGMAGITSVGLMSMVVSLLKTQAFHLKAVKVLISIVGTMIGEMSPMMIYLTVTTHCKQVLILLVLLRVILIIGAFLTSI